MSNCKLRSFGQNGSILTMTCDEIRENHYEMKSDFRKANRTDEIMKQGGVDKMYVRYCESIDDFLYKCKCVDKISLKCEKCPDEEHEGHFCRCEGRNIALAKQLRKDK